MEPIQIIFSDLRAITESFLAHIPNLFFSGLVLLMTWGLGRLLGKALHQVLNGFQFRKTLIELFRKLSFISIWVLGLLVATIILFPTLTPAKVLTALGLGSIAVGFAFKDIFENFFAGILILFREPFQLNDFIECQNFEGFVEEITIRDTHIRLTDGQRVVMPNAMLFKNPVTVRTDQDRRRVSITCGIAYGEHVDEGRDVIRNALQGLESVDQQKDIQIFAKGFGSSSIDFEVTWWTGARPLDIRQSRDKVVAAVKKALDEAGIEIPFPYRTLTFKEPLRALQDTLELSNPQKFAQVSSKKEK